VSLPLTRRAALVGATLAPLGCRARRESPTVQAGGTAPRSSEPHSASSASVDAAGAAPPVAHMLDFPQSPVGPERALALVPGSLAPGVKLPVLVALHGRGEAVRGLDVGARAWVDDYKLERAVASLLAPPLTADAFEGLVDPERLRRINASLAERPYRGLIIVCPWVPDLLSERDRGRLDAANPFAQFLTEQLLPAVVAQLPGLSDQAATGIDGVSLGGRVALLAGLLQSARFGAVGTLQAAIQAGEIPDLVQRVTRAMATAPSLKLRLVTSERDYFRAAIVRLHDALAQARVAHEHLLLPGPHDYVWNRGPGGIEMLLWHDRVLRGEAPL
jgi:enterochelin esterase-like enzyme